MPRLGVRVGGFSVGGIDEGVAIASEHKEHNTRQIKRYLEFAPSFIGPGAPPDEPMGKKHKGVSRPPATEKAMDFWAEPCNADAARLLEPRIAELRVRPVRWRGVFFSGLLAELYSDPTTVPRWERREGDGSRRLAAFDKMCRLLADSLAAEHPGRQINVKIPKRDTQRRAEEWQAEHNRDNNDKRSERARALAEMIREQYAWLKREWPDSADSDIRTRLQHDFAFYATKGNDRLSRETVNKALREGEHTAA